MPGLHIYKNEKETCQHFAAWLSDLIAEALKKQDRFTVAVSGGDTPKALYKILAAEYATKIDWNKVHVFWGDECFASLTNDRNNTRLAIKTFIDQVPIPKEQVHVIHTDLPPEAAAKRYDQLLRSYFSNTESTFDLVILGIGEEGNMLSLFPGNEENNEKDAWAIAVYNKQEDLFRITLTVPVISGAAVKAFLLTGKNKEDVVQQVLKGKYEPEKYPAQLIQTADKSVHWFLDEGAAGKLTKPIS